MRTYIILSFAFVLLLAMSGCKGYEDGPVVSMRTVENRLCRGWGFEGFWINEKDNLSEVDSLFGCNYGKVSGISFFKHPYSLESNFWVSDGLKILASG